MSSIIVKTIIKLFLLYTLLASISCSAVPTLIKSCSDGFVPYANSICDTCGVTKINPNVKIVGGIPAKMGSWPAHVLIYQQIQGWVLLGGRYYYLNQGFVCGGTLISRNTVMSAAHCITTQFKVTAGGVTYTINNNNAFDVTQYTIYAGAHDLTKLGLSPVQRMAVKKVIRHPNYNAANILNDIAIYQLANPVQLNDYVQIACLPYSSFNSAYPGTNVNVRVPGWGLTSDRNSAISNILNNVQLTLYNPSFCSKVATSVPKNWNSQICAGFISGGKGVCNGDSGGGLYFYDANLKKYFVVGITSYRSAVGCARPGFPDVYTRVSFFLTWIKANMA